MTDVALDPPHRGAAGGSAWSIWPWTSAWVIGVAWVVFGLPHLIYHASHSGQQSPVDAIGNAVTLGGSLILGIELPLPEPPNRTRSVAAAEGGARR